MSPVFHGVMWSITCSLILPFSFIIVFCYATDNFIDILENKRMGCLGVDECVIGSCFGYILDRHNEYSVCVVREILYIVDKFEHRAYMSGLMYSAQNMECFLCKNEYYM